MADSATPAHPPGLPPRGRGTAEYNLPLGERRADAAKKFLVDLGIDAKRISTISYGEERPIDPRHNEEAWAKNRNDGFVIN